jgi:hypothetical protein
MFCPDCGSQDIFEITIEKHEYWYHCYGCHKTWGNYFPAIPLDEFCDFLKDDGFPLDAERIRKGERASECGE